MDCRFWLAALNMMAEGMWRPAAEMALIMNTHSRFSVILTCVPSLISRAASARTVEFSEISITVPCLSKFQVFFGRMLFSSRIFFNKSKNLLIFSLSAAWFTRLVLILLPIAGRIVALLFFKAFQPVTPTGGRIAVKASNMLSRSHHLLIPSGHFLPVLCNNLRDHKTLFRWRQFFGHFDVLWHDFLHAL